MPLDLAEFRDRLIELAHACGRGPDAPAVVGKLRAIADDLDRRLSEPEPEAPAEEAPPEVSDEPAPDEASVEPSPPEVEAPGVPIANAPEASETPPAAEQARAHPDAEARPHGRPKGRA